jgi:hypothetical protein
MNEAAILNCKSVDEMFMLSKVISNKTCNCDKLMKIAFKDITFQRLSKFKNMREKHVKIIEDNKRSNVFQELMTITDCKKIIYFYLEISILFKKHFSLKHLYI